MDTKYFVQYRRCPYFRGACVYRNWCVIVQLGTVSLCHRHSSWSVGYSHQRAMQAMSTHKVDLPRRTLLLFVCCLVCLFVSVLFVCLLSCLFVLLRWCHGTGQLPTLTWVRVTCQLACTTCWKLTWQRCTWLELDRLQPLQFQLTANSSSIPAWARIFSFVWVRMAFGNTCGLGFLQLSLKKTK